MRKITFVILCISMISLIACKQNDLFDNETITLIKIQDWDEEVEINAITDENLINDLIEEIESAQTSSTADIDIPNPDYRLLFTNDDRIVKELGYYTEEKEFNGTNGQFIDMETGIFYGVTIELSINKNN